MRVAAALALFCASCSFVGVRGPSDRMGVLPDDASKLKCTRSTLLPTIDALGGAAALGVVVGGVILEHSSDDGEPENFTKYYAGPIALVGIVYFVAASYGNNRITWCDDAQERMVAARNVVTPIPPDDRPPRQAVAPQPIVEPKPEPAVEEPAPVVEPEPKPKAKAKARAKRKPKPKPKPKPPEETPKPKPKRVPIDMEPDPVR